MAEDSALPFRRLIIGRCKHGTTGSLGFRKRKIPEADQPRYGKTGFGDSSVKAQANPAPVHQYIADSKSPSA